MLAGTGANGLGGITAARHLTHRGLGVIVVIGDAEAWVRFLCFSFACFSATPGALAAPADVEEELVAEVQTFRVRRASPRFQPRDLAKGLQTLVDGRGQRSGMRLCRRARLIKMMRPI